MTTTSRLVALCGTAALLLGAAACGGNGTPTATGSTGPVAGRTDGPRGDRFPGAFGLVAAVSGSTAQVQNPASGQVAVSWTRSTTFTRQVAAKLADVKVGSCVMVTPPQAASASGGSGKDDAAPPSEVTAARVRITEPVGGTCAPGGRTIGGPRAGAPGGAPTGAPRGGSGRRPLRGFFGAFGKVTAVSGSGFTVASTVPGRDDTTSVAVTVTASTTYTRMARAAASDVKVGVCVSAQGKPDDTGAVTATAIAISPAENGDCAGGFSVRGQGPGKGTQEG